MAQDEGSGAASIVKEGEKSVEDPDGEGEDSTGEFCEKFKICIPTGCESTGSVGSGVLIVIVVNDIAAG